MDIAQFFENVPPELGEGSQYLWQCFGDNAWGIDVGEHVYVIYDVKTQKVYQITFYDYAEDYDFDEPAISYIWIDSTVKQKYLREKKKRDIVDDLFTEVYINVREILRRIVES